MALTINTNVMSLNAQRNLSTSQSALAKSMQRLSSGLRINSAADDAAGMAIGTNMEATNRCLNQAVRNANDGVSLVQTAEGSLNETSNILIRMRELATQAANGTVGSTERNYIQAEVNSLSDEITRISESTTFAGVKLLDGSLSTNATAVVFQVGTKAVANVDTISVTVAKADAGSLFTTGAAPDLTGVDGTNARTALGVIDAAIASVSSLRSDLGATQNRLQSTINNLQVAIENNASAESRIRDVDVAAETANLTRANILTQAGTAILAQANQAPSAALKLLQ